MMIADLVDADDFRERLGELGIDLPSGETPECWARLVLAALPADGLPELIDMLCDRRVSLHPDVRAVLEIIGMPAGQICGESMPAPGRGV